MKLNESKKGKKSRAKTYSTIQNLADLHTLVTGQALGTSSSAEEYAHEICTFFQSIIANMPNHVYWLDRNCILRGGNNQLAHFFNLKSASELVGLTYEEMSTLAKWTDGQGQSFKNAELEVMSTGIPRLNVEEPVVLVDGQPRYFISNKVPLSNHKGEIIGVLGITTDVTDLKEAKEKAEAGVKAKTEFISNISHDIRTPLTGIITFSEYLLKHLPQGEEKEIAEEINRGGEQLLGLLNNVLDLSAMESAEEHALQKSFDLYQLIDDLCELEQSAIKSHHLELHQYIDKRIPQYLISDKMKIHRVLLNLIGNAIKFTKEGGVTIEVNLLEEAGDKVKIEFSVKDTGIGIPEDAQEQVFDRFYKVNPSYKGKFTGNGIGLHIVQKYTHLLGGEIGFKSKVGEGTTFSLILTLPLGEVTTNHDEDYDALLEEEKILSKEEKPSELKAKDGENLKGKPRVLLIEDNVMILRSLKLQVKQFDVSIGEAMTAEIAFELIKNQPYDLIISDIGLPGISGDELVQLVRKYEKEQGIARQKIVALTGHAVEGELGQKCLDAGMDKVYAKPMKTDTLKKLIEPLFFMKKQGNVKNVETKPSKIGGKLGVDLPDTEEQLFELEEYPILDLSVGAKVFGSEEIARELLKDLKKSSIDDDLVVIKEAHETGDWETIERLSHKIKGGACFGTVRLYYALLYMERYLKAGHNRCTEGLYAQMLRVIKETTEYLTKNL